MVEILDTPKPINTKIIFAPDDYVPHWREDLLDEDYHADKTALNSSSLKKMVKSPRAFFGSYFLSKSEEPTKSMKFGTLAHMAILEGAKFKDRYVVQPDFGDFRSSTNRAKRDEWILEQPKDNIICTVEERDKLLAMIDALLSHEQAFSLLSDGKPEIAGYWRDPETKIRCRMKIDFMSFKVKTMVDVKTTQDCDWFKFRRSVEDLRYDFQMMMYDEGVTHITGATPDHLVWLAIESSSIVPEVACYEVPPQYQATGRYEFRRSLRRVKDLALAENSNMLKGWPPAQVDIECGEMSPWFFKNYESKGAFSELIF